MVNRIEQCYRQLLKEGQNITPFYRANPVDAGILFPPSLLEGPYHRYFLSQHYNPHPQGLLSAREAISQYYANSGCQVDPGHILITSSSSESFLYLLRLLTQPGDSVLVARPGYPLLDHIAHMMHVKLETYSLKEEEGWAPDFSTLEEKIHNRTKALILTSPHNPTGAVLSTRDLEQMCDLADRYGLALICDEVFADFYFGEGVYPRLMQLKRGARCFTLNGLSKMMALPGLKLSWIVVSGDSVVIEKDRDQLETMIDTLLTCHYPIQECLPLLFKEGREFLNQYQSRVRLLRQKVLNELQSIESLRCVPPRGGFYLMPRFLDSTRDEESMILFLMKDHHLFVHPGYFYESPHESHLVFSYLHTEEVLERSLKIMKLVFGLREGATF